MSNIAVIETDAVVASMNRARLALSEAKTIQQTKLIVDTAAAAEIYARRQKLGEEASDLALSIKIEALRKLGGMLEQTPRASGVKKAGTVLGGSKVELPKNDAPTLAELGLTKKESALAQKLNALPEEDYQQVRDGNISVAKAIAAVDESKTKSKRAPHIPEPVAEPANDDAPTLAELVDELQAENTRLTAEITALVDADDQKAETIKWHRMYDHAMRSQSEAMAKAAAQQKEAKRLGNIVRECCRVLNLDDPRLLLAEVKKLASRVEAA